MLVKLNNKTNYIKISNLFLYMYIYIYILFRGSNLWGNIGDGKFGVANHVYDPSDSEFSILIFENKRIHNFFLSEINACMAYTDGTLSCYGTNSDGQLGYGNGKTTWEVDVINDFPTGALYEDAEKGNYGNITSVGFGWESICVLFDNYGNL